MDIKFGEHLDMQISYKILRLETLLVVAIYLAMKNALKFHTIKVKYSHELEK